eukprot:1338313-Prymnesium_polylepis.1
MHDHAHSQPGDTTGACTVAGGFAPGHVCACAVLGPWTLELCVVFAQVVFCAACSALLAKARYYN